MADVKITQFKRNLGDTLEGQEFFTTDGQLVILSDNNNYSRNGVAIIFTLNIIYARIIAIKSISAPKIEKLYALSENIYKVYQIEK